MNRRAPAELPVRAAVRPEGLFLDLRDIGPGQLQDPFLQQTVQRVRSRSTVVVVGREDVGKAPPGTAPAGIVFHVGRCGSTLVSQLLKQLDGVAVYSEPLAVNDILVPPHGWSRAAIVGALRTLGACFARHAAGPWVLKLSSWNTLYGDLVLEAFPTTPWVFCVRDPVEVCVSLLERRPGWLRDAGEPSHRFGPVVDPDRASRSAEEYLVRLIAAYFRAVGALDPGRGMLVEYETLPDAAWSVVGPWFGLTIDASARERMTVAARINAKSPVGGDGAVFSADSARKQSAAALSLRRAVDGLCRPELERLIGRLRRP
jgi:hypothetical protein